MGLRSAGSRGVNLGSDEAREELLDALVVGVEGVELGAGRCTTAGFEPEF